MEFKIVNFGAIETGLHRWCRENDFIRNTPAKEKHAIYKISKKLNSMPIGGLGSLIGTATPICVAKSPANDGSLLTDNYLVALDLYRTTDSMEIVLGNGRDKNKTNTKAITWKKMNPFNNVPVRVGLLDGEAFYENISRLAKTGNTVKVVLLTSGTWVGGRGSLYKYGFNTNFKENSEKLVKEFKNVHILAMVMQNRDIRVKYMNRKENIFI